MNTCCEDYSGSDTVNYKIWMYCWVIFSWKLESDNDRNHKDVSAACTCIAGLTVVMTGSTQRTSVYAEFIRENYIVSNGLSIVDENVFIRTMTVVKILPIISAIIGSTHAY